MGLPNVAIMKTTMVSTEVIKIQLGAIGIFCVVVVMLWSACGAAFSKLATATFPAITCSQIATWQEAQQIFAKHDLFGHRLYPRLDGDSDGEACDNLKR